MTKMRYILLIVLILAVAIVSFVLFKTELQHNPPANKQTSYSENIPCTVNENCTNGLSCSTISWTCVDDATYQQEHINQIEKPFSDRKPVLGDESIVSGDCIF